MTGHTSAGYELREFLTCFAAVAAMAVVAYFGCCFIDLFLL